MEKNLSASHCALYISRKRRYCKMLPNPGEIYCTQHLPVNVQLPSGRRRIQCPLDSKHSCYEDELQNHLSRCNARNRTQPIFYEENINSGEEFLPDSLEDNTKLKVSIKDVPTDKLIDILGKLDKIYNEKVEQVSESIIPSTVSDEEFLGNLKHTRQNASLLALLKHNNLIRDGMAVVELGAGRGRLTHWIIQETKPTEKSVFLLVDRASQRHKLDNKYKDSEDIRIERIKIDIKHLDLKKVISLHTCEEMIIISKHLCGVATDLSLLCLTNYQRAFQAHKNDQMSRFGGALIALCCHHCCDWKHYVGKQFLKECGFNEEEFNILLSISSWATCGSRSQKLYTETSNLKSLCYKLKLDLTEAEQTTYGIKSKRLIDQGRIDFLRKQGLRGSLVYYTDTSISLENVALLILTSKSTNL